MIYLDYNSTHPPLKEIIEKNYKLYFENWANPSGISYYSQKNFALIEKSRKKIYELLKKYYDFEGSLNSIVFNSTGTEVIFQLIYSFYNPLKPYAIISPYEHDCFYATCEALGIQTFLFSGNKTGKILPEEIYEILKKNKIQSEQISFVGCITVSNETGVIQPIPELSKICRKLKIPFISDSIQICGKMPFSFKFVDGFAINGHKIGAGPGSSCAVITNPENIKSIFKGGLQENQFRAGTENWIAILNIADAFEWQIHHKDNYIKLKEYQNTLETFFEEECNGIIIAKESRRVFHTTYVIFPEIEDMDFLLISLDQNQIVCSTGSSCKSRTRTPSRTLLSMGYSKEKSLKALRFSTGIFTNQEEIEIFKIKFRKIYKSLKIS